MQTLKNTSQALARAVLGVAPQKFFGSLFLPGGHAPLLSRKRADMIISRVRMVAGLFAVLTPLWILVDALVFPWPVAGLLVAGRVVTTLAFALLAVSARPSGRLFDAYRALAFMFSIPTLFFIYSHPLLSHFSVAGPAAAIAAGYAFLPFVMVAGLSVFPLTASEGAVFAVPVLAAEAVIALMQLDMLNWASHLGAFWLLMLIATVAILAGMSQLSFMMSLIRQATHDGLTGCFARASGEELLEIQFHIAERSGAPLSLVFVDIDHFKQINDRFGHEAGDRVLAHAAQTMRAGLRTGDILLRWGGEEFLLILPNTDGATAASVVRRLREGGLGKRPDGSHVTASFGVAERAADGAAGWPQLVEIADQRMYLAKIGGRDRCVGRTEEQHAQQVQLA
ncbi:GGDEF domain-containing protein [Noviherbaspirillum aridicola]|uniref:diguanylate cyclase n=1 Tax=Noviherbaspirillum aridicola TaxID=2849687 RepID=A0ABQ4Q5P3_9BURK|nr:GGDEF domain-containing protein [Noviherbaspirillum aridicola]GIZ52367.1 GGDEF domain-containing protein [Noviherbaspirillum aridicola]